MTELFRLGERKIIESLVKIFDTDGARMLGDDCAILDMGSDYLLLTTDMMQQATHIPEGAKPEDVGWYAAAINLSDIAAMGGQPLGMVFALGLPKETDIGWLEKLAAGIEDCCSKYGVPVLGGDTKESPNVTITGTALGRVSKSEILRRSGARPGDIIAMTGSLGRGLMWERNRTESSILLRVEPRLSEGQELSASGAVTSCIDLSDGLSTSLHHLAQSGKVGFVVEENLIPILSGLDKNEKELALHYGGEFELLFTIDPEKADKILGISSGIPFTRIGQVIEKQGVFIVSEDGEKPLQNLGYEHFSKEDST
ncbi:MAG: thiamine-phosphate kinase [Thermoplasmata archaeon]|nr:thiamine-phosphate kinase [Thermoplasmata archaeon]